MLREILEAMKPVEMQSLQYMAALRVTVSACESQDLQRMIGRFRKKFTRKSIEAFSDDEWRLILGKVTGKLNQIGVPDLIIDIILENLWPVSFQISEWILYHVENVGIHCSSRFCWTPHISIDYVKTAKALIQNEKVNIQKRFKLACIYCFDSEVRSLWDRLSLPEKISFNTRRNLKKSDDNPIVLYWTYYIQGMQLDFWDKKALSHSNLLKYSVENGYSRAAKYFYGKIPTRQTSMDFHSYFQILLNTRTFNDTDCIMKYRLVVLGVLLSEMHPASTESILLIIYLLEWPLQKNFMTAVNLWQHHFDASHYGVLLKRIYEKDRRGFKDHDYKKLFKELWLQVPENCQRYVNFEESIGFKIFMTFVKEKFGFIFEEKSFILKATFREILLEQETSGNAVEKENVKFLKFLVGERVVIKAYVERHLGWGTLTLPIRTFWMPFSCIRLKEIIHLIDGILKNSLQSKKARISKKKLL